MRYFKLIIWVIIVLVGMGFYFGVDRKHTFSEKRSEIIGQLNATLRRAAQSGEYRCCISPPCKMCFLGEWIFEDGKCNCDSLIVQGKSDEVCPECKQGIKEGECRSEAGTCAIESLK